MGVLFGMETEMFGLCSQDQGLQECAGWSVGGDKFGGLPLAILLLYKVMRAEPHWCGGNGKRGKCANDHVTVSGNWWYVIA